jgi:hypothetical protein
MLLHVQRDTLLMEFAQANREAVTSLAKALQMKSGTAPAIAVYSAGFEGLRYVADSSTYSVADRVAATGAALAKTLISAREWRRADLSGTMLRVPLLYLNAEREPDGADGFGDAQLDTELRFVQSDLRGMTIPVMALQDSLEFVATKLDGIFLPSTQLQCVELRDGSSLATASGVLIATHLERDSAGKYHNRGTIFPRPDMRPTINAPCRH